MNENSLMLVVLLFGGVGAFGRVSLSAYKPNVSTYTLGSVIVGSIAAASLWGIIAMFDGKPFRMLVSQSR